MCVVIGEQLVTYGTGPEHAAAYIGLKRGPGEQNERGSKLLLVGILIHRSRSYVP